MTELNPIIPITMLSILFASMIVGLVEVGPGVCQVDMLVDGRIETVNLPCEQVVIGR